MLHLQRISLFHSLFYIIIDFLIKTNLSKLIFVYFFISNDIITCTIYYFNLYLNLCYFIGTCFILFHLSLLYVIFNLILFTYIFIYLLSIYLFICFLFIYLFIYLFIHSFFCLFIYFA